MVNYWDQQFIFMFPLTLDHITHLLLVPHGAPAKNGHLGHSFLLQPLHRVALRSQQLPHKVELQVYSITMMMIIIDYNNADNDYLLWPQKLNWKYLQCWICIDEKIRFVARAIPDRQSIFVFKFLAYLYFCTFVVFLYFCIFLFRILNFKLWGN